MVPAWKTSWSRNPKEWVCWPNSLQQAFKTFKEIEREVPKLQEYANQYNRLNEMPWREIARELADGVRRRDTRLESARDIMSIAELGKYVKEWRKNCKSVDKLIRWKLFTDPKAPKTLAIFSRPGAYEQPCLC
jgi:hypothetical protein